jgi:hypothetical protein
MVATQQQLDYADGRRKYSRPQAVAFAETYEESDSGILVPSGFEIDSDYVESDASPETFLILSDHNRSPIDVSYKRIETRERMVNGRMRSYHIDDKRIIRLSWSNFPSRAYSASPEFTTFSQFDGEIQTEFAGKSAFNNTRDEYTVDGGAGGAQIKDWYDTHVGPFYVLLAYDNYASINNYNALANYTDALEMYISDFSYNVEKRGATNHDLWSISISLEEA